MDTLAFSQRPVFVLSIDGGGIRGLIPAVILARLEALLAEEADTLGYSAPSLSSCFDLVVGASTGAILAIGIVTPAVEGENKPLFKAADLVDLYLNRSAGMFRRSPLYRLRCMIRPGYDHAAIECIFQEMLGDRRLSMTTTAFMTHAYDIRRHSVRFFKNWRPADTECGSPDYRLRDVARAATAAPTYYRPAVIRSLDGDTAELLIDGGIFANNPAMIGLVEARKLFGSQRRIIVVSIGCGAACPDLPADEILDWGIPGWLLNSRLSMPLLDVIMDAQADNADHHLGELLGRNQDYYRFDCPLPRAQAAMDDVGRENLQALHRLGETIVKDKEETLRRVAGLLVQHSCIPA